MLGLGDPFTNPSELSAPGAEGTDSVAAMRPVPVLSLHSAAP